MAATHLDEHDRACTLHPAPTRDELLPLAIVGSRAPSFHHDLASKLQGLMMAIDEIGEISGEVAPPLVRALDTAHTALRDVLELLNTNRALTKAPTKTPTTVGALLTRAAERVYVNLRGPIVPANLECSVPAMTHALALVLDVAGGPGRGRGVDVTTVVYGGHVVLTIVASPEPPANAGESLALAAFTLHRDAGELRCAGEGSRLIVRLPTSP